jgi:hypothetical protein
MNRKLLIITGPQGSGNHIFSRIFSMHENVFGWEDLLTKYWVPSDQEPFAEYWVDPDKLQADDLLLYNHYLANVSVPFFYDGKRYVPKILEVAQRVNSFGIDVEIAIVVRDRNINELQQQRVRNTVTMPIAQGYYYTELLDSVFPVHFLDTEALFLHREHYLKWIGKTLDFPIAYDDPEIFKYLTEDPNKKYVKYVEEYWLDKEVHDGCQPNRDKRMGI